MVKKNPPARGEKTNLIREALRANPEAKNSEIVATLKREHGIEVSASAVSKLKTEMSIHGSGGTATAVASPENGAAAVRRRRKPASFTCSMQEVHRAKEFVRDMGSVEKAQQAIYELEAFNS